MPDAIRLLTLPMEIRCHIYSFIYLEKRIVGFLQPKSHYTKTALFLSCQQLHQETLEYYYGRNTFSLPLWQRFAVSDWRFLPRHFDLVKVLHLEAKAFFCKSSSGSGKISEHTKNCQRRLEKYLKAIFWANQGVVAPNLKTLIFVDSVPTHSYDREYWDRVIETSKETLDGYVQVFEKLHIGVGEVVVKLQKEYFLGEDDESEVLDRSLD